MRKLGVSIMYKEAPDPLEQPAMIKAAGFDCCFPFYQDTVDLDAFRAAADRAGVEIETVHLPFAHEGNVNLLWEDSPAGDAILDYHCKKLDGCARAGGRHRGDAHLRRQHCPGDRPGGAGPFPALSRPRRKHRRPSGL